MSEFLLPSLVASLGLCIVTCLALGQSRGSHVAGWLLGIVFLLAVVTGTTFLAWQAGLSGLFLLLIRDARRVWSRRSAVTTVMLVVLSGIVLSHEWERQHAAWESHRLALLREQYPLNSISARLAYETRGRSSATDGDAKIVPLPLADDVERELSFAESRRATTPRSQALMEAHRSVDPVDTFNSRRGSSYLLDDIALFSALRSISLTELPAKRGCDTAPSPPVEPYVPTPSPADSALPLIAMRVLHQNAAQDFLDPERFGFVQDRDHVAGFEPHAFHQVHVLGSHGAPGAALTLEHLDLVGLRKPSGPVAYVSENYPNLDELKTADTRLLHDFETRALSRLRTDDDVVIEEADGTVRMLGALRAGNDCIRCHSAERGELIGALSYEFLRKSEPSLQIVRQ